MIFFGGNLTATVFFDLLNNRTRFFINFGPNNRKVYCPEDRQTIGEIKRYLIGLLGPDDIPKGVARELIVSSATKTDSTAMLSNQFTSLFNWNIQSGIILVLLFFILCLLVFLSMMKVRRSRVRNRYSRTTQQAPLPTERPLVDQYLRMSQNQFLSSQQHNIVDIRNELSNV